MLSFCPMTNLAGTGLYDADQSYNALLSRTGLEVKFDQHLHYHGIVVPTALMLHVNM